MKKFQLTKTNIEDNDDVLTMLVHVSHAWLGGGGLILIFNCYLPPHHHHHHYYYYCRHDDCNSVVTNLLIELLNIIHNTGPHDIIMILNRRVVDKVHCSGSPDSCQLSNLSTIQFSVSHPVDPFDDCV